jgi:hypothetical protein
VQPPPATRATGPTHGAAGAPAGPLSDQVALVDEARRHLAGGDPSAALAATRSFEERFGASATLHPEAMLVAVQAHLASGDEAAAERAAAALAKAHPTSAATRRAAEILRHSASP